MAHDVRPTTPADLPELSRFLTEGFGASSDAPFASVDVLRWKYFDDFGDDAGPAPRSWLARDPDSSAVVGHVGVCPGRFRGPGLPDEGLSTLHMIDWLAAEAGRGVGAALMHRAHGATATQYGLGGSAAGRGVIGRGGYSLVSRVLMFQRVLRPTYRLKLAEHPPAGRVLRAGRDVAGLILRPARRAKARVELRRVEAFGSEVEPILEAYRARAAFTSRGPGLLNHLLRHPGGGVSGWLLLRDGVARGLGVLSVLPRPGGVREGRVAECLLDDPDPHAWHAALLGLTEELKTQRADLALGFASTEWAASAFRALGYAPRDALEFRLRDRTKRVPRGGVFHLSPLEADYTYT